MPAPNSPQFRFLLRGSGLLLALITLWWWALVPPLLWGVRMSTDLILRAVGGGSGNGSVTVAPDGGWLVRVPISESISKRENVQRAFGRAPDAPPVKVRSFRLAIAERIPIFFTLGFPLFWAVVLAGPFSRRVWRILAIGTGILFVLTICCLLFYTAYSIQANMALVAPGLMLVVWNGVEYLNVNVVCYMAPLLLGLWLHDDLRTQIFSWDPVAVAVPVKVVEAEKSRRGRYRG